MTENEMLWRRIDQGDAIIEQHAAANEMLRMEVGEWQAAHAALSRDRFPSLFGKLKANVEVAAIGALIGGLAWEAIR